MAKRDNFTEQTKRQLALRAAHRCSICDCTTSGPSDESSSSVSIIGDAAHIHAAAPGGRRYLASMTPGQRSHIDNAIWLCATHARLIDRDSKTYTADVLRKAKKDHETKLKEELAGPVMKVDSLSGSGFLAKVAVKLDINLGLSVATDDPQEQSSEDPVLHSQIDGFRDLFSVDGLSLVAKSKFEDLDKKIQTNQKPWAKFRIKTNLASIAIDIGHMEEAARLYENAFSIRPTDPSAIANLALARLIQGRYEEAMALADQALKLEPRCDRAIGYLLQAAGRSQWQGDPESLIPPDMIGTVHADIGFQDFLARRNLPHWAEWAFEASKRHSDTKEFKRIGGMAALALALGDYSYVPGSKIPISAENLEEAANNLKLAAEHCLTVEYADTHDLIAFVNNAGVSLRLTDRDKECEELLDRALKRVPDDPLLRRLMALTLIRLGRPEEAQNCLSLSRSDAENQLLSGEIAAQNDPVRALERLLEMDIACLDKRLRRQWLRIVGELAVTTGNSIAFDTAIGGLRHDDPEDILASILEVQFRAKQHAASEPLTVGFAKIIGNLKETTPLTARYILAEELFRNEMFVEAANVLDNRINLSSLSPILVLYLQALSAARLDSKFQKCIVLLPTQVRQNAEVIWLISIHYWNTGDLIRSLASIEELIQQQANSFGARWLKIEILIRSAKWDDLEAELQNQLEGFSGGQLTQRLRLATILGHFGYFGRALKLAYQLLQTHRDQAQSWMTFSGLMLTGAESHQRLFEMPVVSTNAAVSVRYSEGEDLSFIVEPDPMLRQFTEQAWEPSHPIVQLITGKKVGDDFETKDGRKGTIIGVRHKYVARHEEVLDGYQTRFPTLGGIRKLNVDFEAPNGLDQLIQILQGRSSWIEDQANEYANGPLPLALFANITGLDVVEAAAGVCAQGLKIKVAAGTLAERDQARLAVQSGAGAGCILDLYTYWNAFRLQALAMIEEICGPLHIPQSALDKLRLRGEMLAQSRDEGIRMSGYKDGKINVHEISPEVVALWHSEIEQAIEWIEKYGCVLPLIAGDELPDAIRDLLRTGKSDAFDSIILSMEKNLLLLTDDLPLRQFQTAAGNHNHAWLQAVAEYAWLNQRISIEIYVKWLAYLIDHGQSYIAISPEVLVCALELDGSKGQSPGYHFKTLCLSIGGKIADPESHLRICLYFLRYLWSEKAQESRRHPATSLLLSRLTSERTKDHSAFLKTLLYWTPDIPILQQYIRSWARGHFFKLEDR